MKLALFYKTLKNKIVQCQLCPNFCVLKPEQVGECNTRKNVNGKLYSLSYAKLISVNVDPIEKKPLYHFLPGSKSLSITTAGCPLHCVYCQNYTISQANPEDLPTPETPPEKVVELAKRSKYKSIAYTYTDPVAFYEYVLDTAKLAKKARIKNILVMNGYINKKPLERLIPYIDAANVDIKSMEDKFYRRYCGGRIQPVLDSIKLLYKKKVWTEITNLLIPTLNDKNSQIHKLAEFVGDLNPEIPLHFSAYYPAYKLRIHATPAETVERARKIALKEGLKYVYTGNISDFEGSNTYCPKCREIVIKREGYSIEINKCKHKLPIVWK